MGVPPRAQGHGGRVQRATVIQSNPSGTAELRPMTWKSRAISTSSTTFRRLRVYTRAGFVLARAKPPARNCSTRPPPRCVRLVPHRASLGHRASLANFPALVPSALGRALRAYTAQDRYSASSSSASSTAWSVLTDDDDSEFDDLQHDLHLRPNALSYARRPSGTNNPLPRLHQRTRRGDASFDRTRFLSDDDTDCDVSDFASDAAPPEPATVSAANTKSSIRRKRNRASLPTYFSMLQINSSAAAQALPLPYPRASPTSGHTFPRGRPSPPTPKLSVIAGLASKTGPRQRTEKQQPVADDDQRVADDDQRVADDDQRVAAAHPGFGYGRSGLISHA
ncbi:hypothetical protein C8R47DRAFT_1276926 [Mycena vitilis]|nr:hypothetical protein C8R47DRAFT_1276926 [Mycena vitilis]